jgi:hypothetical protein
MQTQNEPTTLQVGKKHYQTMICIYQYVLQELYMSSRQLSLYKGYIHNNMADPFYNVDHVTSSLGIFLVNCSGIHKPRRTFYREKMKKLYGV